MRFDSGCYYLTKSDFIKAYVYRDGISDDGIFDHGYAEFNELVYDYAISGDLKEINIEEVKNGNFIFVIGNDGNVIKDNTNAYFFLALGDSYRDADGEIILKFW